MKTILLVSTLFACIATPAWAQSAAQSNPAQIDQAVRNSASALANAQTLLLQIPNLVEQIDSLQKQLAASQAEVAKLKPTAKVDEKKP